MADRITEFDLKRMADKLNKGRENEPYNAAGKFGLDFAYGGCKLVRYNEGGTETDISSLGYATKKDLYHFMAAYIAGRQSNA